MMKKPRNSLHTRALALLLVLVCVVGLFPASALAAGNTIKLDSLGFSGVRYQSDALGSCQLHQMRFNDGGQTKTGFCGTKGGGMGASLIGQSWTRSTEITDPTVKMMVAYYYAHATNTYPDIAKSMGVNETWSADFTWYYNAWVQAIIWRYQEGTLNDPVEDCAEELMHVLNSLRGWNKQSIDDDYDGASFRARTQYIMDLGKKGCWGDSKVYLYNFAGKGSSQHPAGSVQSIVLGDLIVDTTQTTYTLTVRKVDATNPNKGISGAKFRVQSENGSYSKDIVTGNDGTYTLKNLSAATYAITETEAPDGYQIDDAGPQYATLPKDDSNTVTVTFTDTPEITGKGSIRKVDADDPTKGLAGAAIKITGVDNPFTGTYVTGTGGYLTDVPWDTMPHGSFTAEEVTPPAGYSLSPDAGKVKQSFTWDGKTDVALVFENDAKVKLKFVKQDASGSPLENAVFAIIKDGQVVATEATDASGEIIVPNVTEGLYAFAEVIAPTNKARLEHPAFAYVDQATVEGGGTVTVTAVDEDLPDLTILKRDAQTKAVIPGTVFEVRGVRYGYHQDVTTGEDGTAVLNDLPVDSYEVTEKSVPDPYVISDEPTQTVWLGGGDSRQLIFDNLKQPELTVKKVDAVSGQPIPGTVFTVEGIDNDYKDDWTTGPDGTITGYVQPGTYRITEKSVPSPYLLDWEGEERSLRAGETYTVVAKDHQAPSIEILKTDSVTGDPLPNVRIQVWYASNHTETGEYNDLGVFTTDENGRIVLTEPQIQMRDGWYRVKELAPPKGYAIKDSDTQEAFVPAGKSHTFRIENTPLSAIAVWKFDDVTKEAIPGCTFRVSYLGGDTSGTGGTVVGTYTTSANGSFTVTGLKAGYYIIEEVASDADHVISCPPQTVYISGKDQDVVQVYFGNVPKGSVLVKKVSAKDGSPLSDVEFLVTEADGTLVGDANGKFVTDSSGSFTIEGLDPGTTLVIKETRAKPGYLLDDTPQTVVVKPGRTVTLEFRNQPKGSLIIEKRDSVTGKPLEGVEFELKYADGSYVDNGKLSSKGRYWTDKNGRIIVSGIVGTVVVTEVKTIPGYAIHEASRSQTVQVDPDDTQTLYFENDPLGGVEIVKVSAADKTERIPNVTFEIRKMDDALIDTITTDKNGRASLALEDGAYYAVEIDAPKEYQVDNTPHYFEVKSGKMVQLKVENSPFSGLILHKIDSVTGKGIYGVKFVLYDMNKKPIDEFETDQDGYIYIDDVISEGTQGRFYLRELEAAPGYELDKEYKTVNIKPGKTVEIEWKNTPITGQIQLYKYAAAFNQVTGTAAGAPLKGAVYEISEERSGKVVDYITTDARGVAASKPLPLGRYKIVEVSAPAFWQLDTKTVFDVTLEYSGQIIKLSAYDKPSSLDVSITKRGNKEVLAGNQMWYAFTVANNSNVALNNFYWHDRIPTDAVRAASLVTGTYSFRLNYRVLYKTNYSSGYVVLASNLLTTSNYSFNLNAIPMQVGEYVTDIKFDFGKVPVGFQSVKSPQLAVVVSGTLPNGYQIINRCDVGGKYQNTWDTDSSSWVTIVRKLTPSVKLPKTGY